MVTDEQATRPDCDTAIDDPLESLPRSLQDQPTAIRLALRRVVHDHVKGWAMVRMQTPRERRRKKRLWDHRTAERQAFRRPVWVHKARWVESSPELSRTVVVERCEELYLVQDISDSGIGLTSDTPPKSRLVVMEFDAWQGPPIELLVQLRWRKRVREQDYRCGGNILGVLTPE